MIDSALPGPELSKQRSRLFKDTEDASERDMIRLAGKINDSIRCRWPQLTTFLRFTGSQPRQTQLPCQVVIAPGLVCFIVPENHIGGKVINRGCFAGEDARVFRERFSGWVRLTEEHFYMLKVRPARWEWIAKFQAVRRSWSRKRGRV